MSTLADRLDAARRRDFVGRTEELDRVGKLLAAECGAVVFVDGPGGIGKSALLHQIAALGEQLGRTVFAFDGRAVAATPTAMLAYIAKVVDVGDPLAALGELPRALFLVDNVDLLAPIGRWARLEVLPRISSDAVVVFAGRNLPLTRWRSDHGWQDVLHSMVLGDLADHDARTVLRRRGLPEPVMDAALAFTRGHPLALTLVADEYAKRGTWTPPARAPRVVAALRDSLVGPVPSAPYRAALDAGALAWVVTEPLLAAMIGLDDVRELFDWLRGLSCVEHGPRGLQVYPLARDVLAADLRWRDPRRHRELLTLAEAYYRGRLDCADPDTRADALLDHALLHHGGRSAVVSGEFWVAAASGAWWPSMRVALAGFEGEESARLADFWYRRRPDSTLAVHDADGRLAGWFLHIGLHDLTAEDLAMDPGTAAVREHLDRTAPLRAGETASLLRFWLAIDGYQAISAIQTRIAFHLAQHSLASGQLAFTAAVCADPERWADMAAGVDLHRLPEADFVVGGRRYGVFGHDWRVVPPDVWLSNLTTGQRAGLAAVDPLRVLDEEAFAAAVRAALPVLSRPDKLRTSPLLGGRLVAARAGEQAGVDERIAALRQAITEAAAALGDTARDRRAHRALHHTFIQPAETQRLAAELLDLPITTYRRHLAAGIRRVTELLWQEELRPAPVRRRPET